jgi:16S rRNA A1518/A1519 N6-dimethyltransferase RsmA/KsgA/DIM1 with predicted DNA glycosylase/AP lyase activity
MRSVAPTTVSSEQGLKDLAEVLQRVGIDPGRRPETLTPAEFGALSVELGRSRRSAADV